MANKVTAQLCGTVEMPVEETGLQATTLKDLSEGNVIKKVGPLCTTDMKKSGILASVTLAQFILESGNGKSELAQAANNVFGMKKSLSGNTWSGSAWDGKSVYTKKTQEDDGTGKLFTITANFRKYPCIEDPIASLVVKRIFDMADTGMSPTQIAKQLQEEQVLIPSAYTAKYHPEQNNGKRYFDPYGWSNTMIIAKCY